MASRIVIMDDVLVMAQQWETALVHAGYRVDLVTEPEKLLDELAKEPTHLLVLDMMMPIYAIRSTAADPSLLPSARETGIWLCSEVHKLYPSLPIIGATVVRDREKLGRFRAAGARTILTKPITTKDFLAAVKAMLPAG